MRPTSTTVLLFALAATACTHAPMRSPTLSHLPVTKLADDHEAILVREYNDEIKLGGGREQRLRVQYLWDYSAASARAIRSDLAGHIVSDELLPALTLNATPEELAYAEQLVRADARIDARFTPDTDLYGGFSFREPGHPACDLHSRCIHVIASRDDGRFKVVHAIVDLQTARVIDADYDPTLGGIAEPRTPVLAK